MTKTSLNAATALIALAAAGAVMAPPKDQGNKAPATDAPLIGAALLSAIAAGTVTRVSQDQANSLDGSHYAVDTTDVVDGYAAISLTDAGKAAANGAAPAASKGGFAIDDDVKMPEGTRRRAPSETLYPFDALNVGQSFHVPVSDDNKEPAVRLSSSVSGAHIRYSEVLKNADGSPQTEEYTSPVYKRTEDGKGYAKDADGKRIKERDETKTRDKRGEPSRTFRIVTVDATDPRGVGARVFRVS